MIQKVRVKRQASVTSPTFSSSVAEQALSCRVQTLMPGKEDGGNGKDNSPERQLVATSRVLFLFLFASGTASKGWKL